MPHPEEKIVPAQDVQKTEQPAAPTQEPTIQEALNPTEKPEASAPKVETVPLAAHIELKKSAKAAAKRVEELEQLVRDGASKEEITETARELSEEFPEVDPNFIKKFEASVLAKVTKVAERNISESLRPLQEEKRAGEIDKRFNDVFARTMANMPEYKDLVNKSVIKTMSLSPENANKTFTQIIEEAYGHLVTGKRTMDPATNQRVSKDEAGELDMSRAKTDSNYFKEVMANPSLKKQYNDKMMSRLSSQL